MDKQTVSRLRRGLALAIMAGKIADTLRQLKNMPLADLEIISEAETKKVLLTAAALMKCASAIWKPAWAN